MFENIVGHEKQKEILSKIITSNNISHAYLFFGDEGIGKFKIACEFAKEILNTDNLTTHPDFKIISKNENKKDILVEQIRKKLIDDIYVIPAVGERKVYIINDAHDLNIASQNTLLKTLEEPPRYITIILVASNISSFLTTILSRVNQIPFTGITNEQLKNYMKDKYSIKVLKFSSDIEFESDNLLDYLEFILYKNNEYNCIKIIENAKNRLKMNGNYDIIIDSMLLRLIDSIKEE